MEANRPRIEIIRADAGAADYPADAEAEYAAAYDYAAAEEQAGSAAAVSLAQEAAPVGSRQRTRRGSRGRGGKGNAPRPSPLSALEGFFEGLFEGSFKNLFRSKLQPAELAHRLERAMEDGQQVSVGKTFVPNAYELELNPEDYAAFANYTASLEHELAEYVSSVSKQRGYRMTTRFPRVRLIENPDVGRREVRATGRIVDPRVDPAGAAQLEGEIERTRAMRIPPQFLATPRPASLTIMAGKYKGKLFPLQGGTMRLGRGLDNDTVIDDPRVSRHHAEVRWQAGNYILLDLGSTNGTFLNDMQITEAQLSVGDRISLGGLELLFQ